MTTFTAIDGSTVTPRTRADLMQHPAFVGLNVDSEGNPCVWENSYECECGEVWEDNWSCGCDDDCPKCCKAVSPYRMDWLPRGKGEPGDPVYYLWDDLPEAGSLEAMYEEGEAAMAEQDRRETATILAALRFWQAAPEGWKPARFMDIATDGETLEPMTAAEIDRLCEQINLNVEADPSF